MDDTNIVYEKDNRKVPIAILSCFLIAFILQGILKISGVFIFEKALDWDIFNIIDNNRVLSIIFQILINIIAVHCLSFAFTTRAYSNKWYHWLIITVGCSSIITIRMTFETPFFVEFIYDILLYVTIPFIVNITTERKYKVFEKTNVTSIVTTLSIQILLYFCYLGLCYWSNVLSSSIPNVQTYFSSSKMFLIYFELYIGLVLLMLSLNTAINKIKRRE